MARNVPTSPAAPTATYHVRVALAGLVCVMVAAGAIAHLGAEALRRRADERARLGALADLAASVLQAEPATMQAEPRGHTLKRFKSGDAEAVSIGQRFAQALIARGAADALAVIDGDGVVVRHWPQHEGSITRLSVPPLESDGRIGAMDGAGVPMVLACSSLGERTDAWADGYACVLRATLPVPNGSWARSAWMAAGMAAFGLLGFLAAAGYLRRRLCAPLERITSAVAVGGAGELSDRTGEIGAIARRLNELSGELQTAREDAQRLKHTMESAVTRETKQISSQLRRAERVAELDALTGLANRRFIHERLEGVFSEQRSRSVNLAIVMLDVDNFKPLNDQAGHAAGDALLRFVGELLRGTLRDGDVAVRYGGDEFALVLVDVSGAQARVIAERIVRLFAQRASVARLPAPVTLSAGVASLDEVPAASGAELLARADDALYRSKRSGKNVVQAATN